MSLLRRLIHTAREIEQVANDLGYNPRAKLTDKLIGPGQGAKVDRVAKGLKQRARDQARREEETS